MATIVNKTYSGWTDNISGNTATVTPYLVVSQTVLSNNSSEIVCTVGFTLKHVSGESSLNYVMQRGDSQVSVDGTSLTLGTRTALLRPGATAALPYSGTLNKKHNFSNGIATITITGQIVVAQNYYEEVYHTFTINETVQIPLDLSSKLTSAVNFTDEQDPTITYSVVSPASNSGGIYADYPSYTVETVTVEAAISADGTTPTVAYRQIPNSGTSYTFDLTYDEIAALILAAGNNISIPIYFLLKTTRTITVNNDASTAVSKTFNTQLQRVFTIVSEGPSMIVDVVDSNPTTLALTGNEDRFIKYHSDGAFTIEATPGKGATITRLEAKNGIQSVTDATSGTLYGVETNEFIFTAVDSRAMATSTTMIVDFIDYIKLTGRQQIKMELAGETGATANVTISGNYFNGNFGAQSNALNFEIRHTQNDGTMGEWTQLLDTFTQDGHSYEKNVTISGLRYDIAYTFQCRISDKLEVFTTPEYTVRVNPVFDWSENDFNFNVPVNFNGDITIEEGGSITLGTTGFIGKDYDGNNALTLGSYASIVNKDENLEVTATRLDLNAEVYVNGEALGGGGSSTIESGSWTPAFNTAAAVSSYTNQRGWYQKVGNVVTIGFMLSAVCNSGYESQLVKIKGLPYTPAVAAYGGGVCSNLRVAAAYNFQCWAAGTDGLISTRFQACNNTSVANLGTSGSTGSYPSGSGITITTGGTITYLTNE